MPCKLQSTLERKSEDVVCSQFQKVLHAGPEFEFLGRIFSQELETVVFDTLNSFSLKFG